MGVVHEVGWVRTFMMRSPLKVPTPAIPMPDFAVPYAAPMPVLCFSACSLLFLWLL